MLLSVIKVEFIDFLLVWWVLCFCMSILVAKRMFSKYIKPLKKSHLLVGKSKHKNIKLHSLLSHVHPSLHLMYLFK